MKCAPSEKHSLAGKRKGARQCAKAATSRMSVSDMRDVKGRSKWSGCLHPRHRIEGKRL